MSQVPPEVHGIFFVTGPSGAGKTTLIEALDKRGYNTLQAKCHFVDEANRSVPQPWKLQDSSWVGQHRWVFNQQELLNSLDAHEDDHLFIEGVTADMGDYLDCFDRVFFLKPTEKTLRSRLSGRDGNTYGAKQFQADEILAGFTGFTGWAKQIGATVIDADRPVDSIVSDIITGASV